MLAVQTTNDPGKSRRIFQVRRSILVIGRRAERASQAINSELKLQPERSPV
jgi:hypothetical protein